MVTISLVCLSSFVWVQNCWTDLAEISPRHGGLSRALRLARSHHEFRQGSRQFFMTIVLFFWSRYFILVRQMAVQLHKYHTASVLSPVHSGDKDEFNTVDFLESRLLLKPATNRQQSRLSPYAVNFVADRVDFVAGLATNRQQLEFDSLSRSTLSPARFSRPNIERPFDFVATVMGPKRQKVDRV